MLWSLGGNSIVVSWKDVMDVEGFAKMQFKSFARDKYTERIQQMWDLDQNSALSTLIFT